MQYNTYNLQTHQEKCVKTVKTLGLFSVDQCRLYNFFGTSM